MNIIIELISLIGIPATIAITVYQVLFQTKLDTAPSLSIIEKGKGTDDFYLNLKEEKGQRVKYKIINEEIKLYKTGTLNPHENYEFKLEKITEGEGEIEQYYKNADFGKQRWSLKKQSNILDIIEKRIIENNLILKFPKISNPEFAKMSVEKEIDSKISKKLNDVAEKHKNRFKGQLYKWKDTIDYNEYYFAKNFDMKSTFPLIIKNLGSDKINNISISIYINDDFRIKTQKDVDNALENFLKWTNLPDYEPKKNKESIHDPYTEMRKGILAGITSIDLQASSPMQGLDFTNTFHEDSLNQITELININEQISWEPQRRIINIEISFLDPYDEYSIDLYKETEIKSIEYKGNDQECFNMKFDIKSKNYNKNTTLISKIPIIIK